MNAREVQERLRSLAEPEAAATAAHYFKTGPGEYGNGDVFLGLRAADMHALAKEFLPLAVDEITVLLRSPIHEDRLLALLILVRRVFRGDAATRKEVYPLYLATHGTSTTGTSSTRRHGRLSAVSLRTRAASRWTASPPPKVSGSAGSASSRPNTSSARMTLSTRSGSPSGFWATAKT